MNSLMVIAPYRYLGTWVFDDPDVGLVREPFVAGADTILDLLSAGIPNAEKGFRITFSADTFPGAQHEVVWRRAEEGGNWYYSPELDMEGWLCPALFKYFEGAPKKDLPKVRPLGIVRSMASALRQLPESFECFEPLVRHTLCYRKPSIDERFTNCYSVALCYGSKPGEGRRQRRRQAGRGHHRRA